MATQLVYIPEIINGTWTSLRKHYTIPTTCTKCSATRGLVKNFSTTTYGAIIRAKCPSGCSETYEDLRLQAEAYKNNTTTVVAKPGGMFKNAPHKGAASSLPLPAELAFFKQKGPTWTPDTIIGQGYSSQDGMHCSKASCKEFVPFAGPNQPDGKTFVCRKCRVRI